MSFFKKYEYVLAVSKHGGISQAAEALNISQPTLSKFLKKLETEVGAELFDRSALPISLTPAGEIFLESGKRILDIERQLQKQLKDILSQKNTVIKVGISPSRSPYVMPSIIEAYKAKQPDCRIIIEERTTAELNSRLEEGNLDLIITMEDDNTQKFIGVPLFEEDLLLAIPSTVKSSGLEVKDILKSVPLINVGKGQVMWQTTNAIADAMGIDRPNIECQSIESGLALVKHGIGSMIVPSYIADFGNEAQKASLSFLSLPSKDIEEYNIHTQRQVCMFYRKAQFLTQAEKDFVNCVQTIFKLK